MAEVSIKRATQVMVANAGTDEAKAFFEVILTDGRKTMFAKISENDPNLYFQNQAAINTITGIGSDVAAMYLDVFPTDIKIVLSTTGALPVELQLGKNYSFASTRTGTVGFNGYDPSKGLYNDGKGNYSSDPTAAPAVSTVAGNTVVPTTTETSWFQKPIVKTLGWVSLGLGVVVGVVVLIFKGKKKK